MNVTAYLLLVASLAALALGIVVLLKVLELAQAANRPASNRPSNTGTGGMNGMHGTNLDQQIVQLLSFPGVSVPVAPREAARAQKRSPAMESISDLVELFAAWRASIGRQFPKSTLIHSQIKSYAEKFKALELRAQRDEKATFSDTMLLHDIQQAAMEAASFAVEISDRDTDKDRAIPAVQNKLDELVRLAGLTLWTPSTTAPYRDPQSGEDIRIKEVLVRGLRTSDGTVILRPEVQGKG